MRISRKITEKMASAAINGIAYTVVGSEVVRDNLTRENMGKALSAIGRAATTTTRTVRSKAGSLRNAVNKRKAEILSAKSDKDSLI